jgi:hypothetical protein
MTKPDVDLIQFHMQTTFLHGKEEIYTKKSSDLITNGLGKSH